MIARDEGPVNDSRGMRSCRNATAHRALAHCRVVGEQTIVDLHQAAAVPQAAAAAVDQGAVAEDPAVVQPQRDHSPPLGPLPLPRINTGPVTVGRIPANNTIVHGHAGTGDDVKPTAVLLDLAGIAIGDLESLQNRRGALPLVDRHDTAGAAAVQNGHSRPQVRTQRDVGIRKLDRLDVRPRTDNKPIPVIGAGDDRHDGSSGDVDAAVVLNLPRRQRIVVDRDLVDLAIEIGGCRGIRQCGVRTDA